MLIINILVLAILVPVVIFAWTLLFGLVRWYFEEKKELSGKNIK